MATSTGMTREGTKKNSSLRDFQGINTQAARQAIKDDQFAWLENVMPIGFGNMPVVPGPLVTTAAWSGTAYHMRSINILGVDYEVVFTSNGAITAVNLATYAVTTVAVAGTLSGADSEICQWSNTQAVIVDVNGYFSWDGTTLTKWNGTVASLTITSVGTGYTSSPTIGFSGGGGSGAAATSHIQVKTATISAAGTGYNVGDDITIAGGTAVRAAKVRVSAIGGGGTVTGANLIDAGDYTASPTNPAATTSLYGTGATFTLDFGIGPITITNKGTGYTSAPAVAVTVGGGSGGAVTAVLSVVPAGGTSVTTFAGRVWVSSGRNIAFSAPGSFNDFSIATAGGVFIMTDETLVGNIIAVRAANNFLYIVGKSSVNVVADVSVVNGSTVFSNTNISASIGTPFENSIYPYYRSLWFANPFGVYALYGSTTQKTSDDLDGIFQRILNEDQEGLEITAGAVVIHEIMCIAFLVKYDDPKDGQRSILLVHFNKKWFVASQGDTLKNIDTAIIGGEPVLYATDGSRLIKLFADDTRSVKQTIVTKLWDMGDPLSNKQALKVGVEVFNAGAPQTFTGSVDTEKTTGQASFSLVDENVIDWVNNAGVVVQWVNNAGAVVDWLASGYSFLPQDIQTVGRYLGVTLNSESVETLYEGVHLQYETRTSWPDGRVA